MKFEKYILPLFVIWGLAACSGSDTMNLPEESMVEKARLALMVDVNESAKTDTETDKDVNTLVIGVFGDGWSTVYDGDADENNAIGPREVYAGKANVVVVANASADVTSELKKATTLADFCSVTSSLTEENMVKGLTMSSVNMEVVLLPEITNYIGYSDRLGADVTTHGAGKEIYGKGAVALYRNVASIYLSSVQAKSEANDNFISKDFVLKEVFIASAKGLSHIAANSTSSNAPIEKTFDFSKGVDAYADYQVGQLFDAPLDEGSYKAGIQTLNPSLLSVKTGLATPIGHEFYVYENTKGEYDAKELSLNADYANHTLLVVKGDYTYQPRGSSEMVTVKDCYYQVVVGSVIYGNFLVNGESQTESIFVKRNYKYAIDLTIKGPGSEVPYDPRYSANLSVTVKVKDWNVVENSESVS